MKIKWIVVAMLILIVPSGAGGDELTCELTKSYASDAKDDQGYGWSVSIFGDRAVVGAAYDSWAEEAKLTASDWSAYDEFGGAVAIGGFYSNWKAGHTVLDAAETMDITWNQVIPALQPVLGDNLFTLVAEDITPAPYNQPPYPPSGDTATDGAMVTGFVP